MKRLSFIVLVVAANIFIAGCVSSRVSTIEGSQYDEKKNQTTYFVLPFGSATMPGKWEKTKYNSTSGQQSFINKDSVSIALAFNSCRGYPFNKDGSKKGFEFVKAFYEWDSKYFADTYGLKRTIIEEDKVNNYIIWRLHGNYNNAEFDTCFLFGEKNGNASNFSTGTDKWTLPFKTEFLKNLFLFKE